MYEYFWSLRNQFENSLENNITYEPTDDLCINADKILYMELLKS
jgi:hypothetical protein